jgi:hypothetical protein
VLDTEFVPRLACYFNHIHFIALYFTFGVVSAIVVWPSMKSNEQVELYPLPLVSLERWTECLREAIVRIGGGDDLTDKRRQGSAWESRKLQI